MHYYLQILLAFGVHLSLLSKRNKNGSHLCRSKPAYMHLGSLNRRDVERRDTRMCYQKLTRTEFNTPSSSPSQLIPLSGLTIQKEHFSVVYRHSRSANKISSYKFVGEMHSFHPFFATHFTK